MNEERGSFPFTNEQFDNLTHFIDMRITAALENLHPNRVEIANQNFNDMKENLRIALVGSENL